MPSSEQTVGRLNLALGIACAVGVLGCASHGEPDATLGTVREAATCASDSGSAVTLYVATTGKSRADGGTGTCANPFLTLQDAEDEIDARDPNVTDPLGRTQIINSQSYTVYLRGGTYAYQERSDSDGHLILDQVYWRVASADHDIRITAYPGEYPIFDGKGIAASAIKVGIRRGGCGTSKDPLQPTRIHITHLTFRHYVERAIFLDGGGAGEVAEIDGNCQGGLTIAYNVFERIGDVYNNVCLEPGKNCLVATAMSSADKSRIKCRWFEDDESSKLCMGRAGIGGFNARNNDIHHNVFSHTESADQVVFGQGNGSRLTAHAVYLGRLSSGNKLSHNFVEYSSGDAFKFTDRGSYNQVTDNFIVHSGGQGMIANLGDDGYPPGVHNSVSGNVTLFGYPFRDLQRTRSDYVVKAHWTDESAWQYRWSGSSGFHEGRRAEYELVGGMALGDVDGDSQNELFVSLKYPAFDISVIRRSSDAGPGRFLGQLVEVVRGMDINHLAIGKLESGKPAQLVSNWHTQMDGVNRTQLWRGDGRPFGGARNIAALYDNDKWIASGLAIGNFDNTGVDELLSAFRSDAGTRHVYRGTGTGIGSSIYQTTVWDILAMTPIRTDANSQRDTLYTSFKRSTSGGGYEARIYAGNGVTSVTSGGSVKSDTTRSFLSLAARDAGTAATGAPVSPELYAAAKYDHADAAVWTLGTDGSNIRELKRSSSGEFVHVVYGAVGELAPAVIAAHERISNVLYSVSETAISSTGGTIFHEFKPAPPCDPNRWSCQ